MPVMIGERNVRGTIEGVSTVQDDTGYPVTTNAPLSTTPTEWVQIEPLQASERIQAQQVFGVTTATLRMRYRTDVDELMRFVSDSGDVWDFLSPPVDPDGKRQNLEVLVGKSD